MKTASSANRTIDKRQFRKLFEPAMIGRLELKNRIVMAPMINYAYGPAGELTERTAAYYAARAKGGVGLIICQSSIIMRESRAPLRCSIYDDKFIPGLRRVADVIHDNGAKGAFQLIHHGRALLDYRDMVTEPEDIRPLAPSPIPRLLRPAAWEDCGRQATAAWAMGNMAPPEATLEDIQRVKQGFANAARRVREAGFDAVELMGGMGYLIGQFLSPLYNRRTDRFGGSIENRARFACEVISAVRIMVGDDFPIILRISGSDFLPGGITLEEVVQQVPLFVSAGADCLHVSAGEQATIDKAYPNFMLPQGVHVPLASAVKKVSKVPVIAVGKIYDPAYAEKILRKGMADFVALGRPLLADPEWPLKVRTKRTSEITPCIYCCNCMNFPSHPHLSEQGISCSVNPALFREIDFTLPRASRAKHVMIAGAGPAGIQAAIILAKRGHTVQLYEKADRLGGQWYIACQQPRKKQDYSRLLAFLERRLAEQEVSIRMNVEVTPSLVTETKPDVVVVATGAFPKRLDVLGADRPNVTEAISVIQDQVVLGKEVVIIGGQYRGMELADQVAVGNRRVSLVTRSELGRSMQRSTYLALRNGLIEKGVHIYPYCPVLQIDDHGVYTAFNNELLFLPADTVISAVGMEPNTRLMGQLKGLAGEIHSIGDCVKPRDVMYAMTEATRLALQI